jgi:hypothetical protein
MSISDRPIRGGLAMGVRRRRAAGQSPGQIARALRLRPRDVAAYLASVEARASRLEWRAGDVEEGPAGATEPAIVAAEGPELVELGPAGDRTMATGCAPDAQFARADIREWGSPHASAGTGGANQNASLCDADAELVRRLRARGVPRGDVARMFDVSVATVTRITRGETYRSAVAEPDQVVTSEPPATSPAITVEPSIWTEPARPGPEWCDD